MRSSLLLRSMTLWWTIAWGIGCAGPGAPAASAPATATIAPPASEPIAPRGGVASPAFRLTTSDGQGLRFVSYRARAVVDGPMAFTDLELTFQNPEDRIVEGRFTAALPDGASTHRLALWMGNLYQEGEIVERQRARRIFESHFATRRDPVLVEEGAGSELTARVFPIAPRQTRHVRLAYTEVLGARGYVLPLAGVSASHVDARVFDAAGEKLASSVGDGGARADLVVPASRVVATGGLEASGLIEGRDAIIRFTVPRSAAPSAAAAAERTILVVDTSASRGTSWQSTLDAAAGVTRALPAGKPLTVIAFDQSASTIFEAAAPADFAIVEAEIAERLAARGPLGASSYDAAFEAVRTELARDRTTARVVFVTDGIATLNGGSGAAIALAGARVDVVAVGHDRDGERLRKIALSGEIPGFVIEGALGAEQIAERLAATPCATFTVGVPSASFVHPTSFSGLAAGDTAIVHVTLDRPRAALVLRVGDAEREVALAPRDNTLVARAVAGARIQRLEAQPQSEATHQEIVALSRKHRLLSSKTALIVLESEADYARFSIPRTREVEVVTADAGALRVERVTPAPPPAADSVWIDQRFVERDGPPSTTEALLAAARTPPPVPRHRTRAPVVRMGQTMVSGRTPPETVQLHVRVRFGTFRKCYLDELRRAPSFAGRVTMRFRIDEGGKVSRAQVASWPDHERHPEFDACMVAAFEALSFPASIHPANVYVDYPIVFGRGAPNDPLVVADTPRWRRFGALPTEEPPRKTVDEAWPWLAKSPFGGRFADVKDLLAAGDADGALLLSRRLVTDDFGDVLAFVALGDAARARGDVELAARAYGSIVDVFPTRADLIRVAASHLLSIDRPASDDVAIAALERAAADRPDRLSAFRLLSLAKARRGRYGDALDVVRRGAAESQRLGTFDRTKQGLCEDATAIGAAYAAVSASGRARSRAVLEEIGCQTLVLPNVRVTLHDEGDHARTDLYLWREETSADRTFIAGEPGGMFEEERERATVAVQIPRTGTFEDAGPWQVGVRFLSENQGGYAMGGVTLVEHDGNGKLRIEERPYVMMKEGAGTRLGLYAPGKHASLAVTPSSSLPATLTSSR